MNVFEITIQRRVADCAPVVVEFNQSGGLPVRNEGRLELAEETLNAQVTPLDYGRALGKALFRDDVREAFARALAQADERLHVLLFVEDEQLNAWHWERLCAPVDGGWGFLCVNQRTPFSLYLPSGTDRRFPPIGRRDLRALIIAASPADLEKRFGLKEFDVARAVGGVRAALGDIPHIVLADLAAVPDAVGPPTLDALAECITAEPVTLLHLVCHGRAMADGGETVIYLADAGGRVAPLSASQLMERLRLLHGARGLPRFAFLSTCESAAPETAAAFGGLGQRLVRDLGMPAVVAMTQKVSVATADALAAAFYPRLRDHGQPDLALVQAAAGLAGRYDITVPALYSRLGGQPLFSDALDRELTAAEIDFGSRRLAGFLPTRAPVLAERFEKDAGTLRATLQADVMALSPEAQKERSDALAAINSLSTEVLDLSFNALALGQEPPAYDARCPFQGLPAFGYEQRAFFFGREQLIARLQERLAEHNFLAVQGPSGSGKSSLVMAGLIPALEQQHPGLRWSVIKPGNDIPLAPIGNRKTEIENASSLLVVDQFEELFTLTTDAKQRQAFIDRLLAVAQAQLVVLTMRADFWGECAFYPALKAEMQAYQELIPPMTAAELRSAVEQQAQAVGLRFEADLAQAILDDVAGEPGAMPLLQHALLELWKRRHGRWLRAEEYRNLGGVREAIARTADGIYDRLSPADQALTQIACLRLIRLDEGDGHRDTRRRATLDELVAAGGGRDVVLHLITRLADEKLLVTNADPASGKQTVELAHEALIVQWARLRSWVNEDRAGNLLHQRLSQASGEWHQFGRDISYLYRGKRLEEARIWERQNRGILNVTEQRFLNESETLYRRTMVARIILAIAASTLLLALLVMMVAQIGPFQRRIIWQRQDGLAENGASTLTWSRDGTMYAGLTRKDVGPSIARSRDEGRTWELLGPRAKQIFQIAVNPDRPQAVYATLATEGPLRSADEGDTWTSIESNLPVMVEWLTVTPDGTLYAGDATSSGGIFVSSDQGDTWTPLPAPSSPWKEVRLTGLSWQDGRLLAATQKHGLLEWTPRKGWRHLLSTPKAIWTAVGADQTLVVGGSGGIFELREPVSPTMVSAFRVYSMAKIPTSPPRFVAVTLDGDLGEWQLGAKEVAMQSIKRDVGNPQFLYEVDVDPLDPQQYWVCADTGLWTGKIRRWFEFWRR